jgi:hypothetical protein
MANDRARAMNLEPGYILANMLVSGVGYVMFMYGKKQRRFPQMAIGIVMLIYPYFVTDVPMMLMLGAVLCGLTFALVKMGI